jgi:hypothetical protein
MTLPARLPARPARPPTPPPTPIPGQNVIVAVNPSSIEESNPASLEFTFTLTEAATAPTTLRFNVTGAAAYGSDFTLAAGQPRASIAASGRSGTLAVPQGASSATLAFTMINDAEYELDEDILVTLVNGTGYTPASPVSATATIATNDWVGALPRAGRRSRRRGQGRDSGALARHRAPGCRGTTVCLQQAASMRCQPAIMTQPHLCRPPILVPPPLSPPCCSALSAPPPSTRTPGRRWCSTCRAPRRTRCPRPCRLK